MKTVEFVQTYYNGGFPVDNQDSPFGHGTPVYVVSKRELLSLVYRVTASDDITKAELAELLKEDKFIQREPDLPPVAAERPTRNLKPKTVPAAPPLDLPGLSGEDLERANEAAARFEQFSRKKQ